MSDYLRARIEALEREVTNLQKKIDLLEAKLEVKNNQQFEDLHGSFNYQQSNTLQQ